MRRVSDMLIEIIYVLQQRSVDTHVRGLSAPCPCPRFFKKIMSVSASVSAVSKSCMSASVSAISKSFMSMSASVSAMRHVNVEYEGSLLIRLSIKIHAKK